MGRLARTFSPLRRSARQGGGAASGYNAFISYSHGADLAFAPSLQLGLRKLAKPWNKRYALRVFLDQTSLSASADLKSDLDGPIAQSEFFILLASTQAADPQSWVSKEVSYWQGNKEMGRFLIAKTDGEISWDEARNDFDWEKTTALPRSLANAFPSEPNFVDFSAENWQAGVSFRDPEFRTAVARLAAPIHGKEMDELVGEDIKQQRRTKRLVRAAVSTLVVLLILASVAAVLAVQSGNKARTQLAKATSLGLTSVSNDQLNTRLDASLLLSLEAFRASPTDQSQSAVISALGAARRSHVQTILRVGHGAVNAVAFSADERTLAAGNNDGTVLIWHVGTAKRQLLNGRQGAILSVALSPSGRWLAAAHYDGNAGHDDGTVLLWDLHAGTRRFLKRSSQLSVNGLAFSPDGHTLASGSGDGSVVVWDVRTGKAELLPPRVDAVGSVAFSPNGRTLAVADVVSGGVDLWGTREHRWIGGLPVETSRTSGVAFSPDGHTIASAGDDGTVLWSARKRTQLSKQMYGKNQHAIVFSPTFSPDGRLLATVDNQGALGLFDLRTRAVLRQPVNVEGKVNAVAFSPHGNVLAYAGSNGNVLLWAPQTDAPSPSGGLQGDVAFSPDGHTLATKDGRAVVLRDLRTGKRQLLDGGKGPVHCFAFSPDGRTLAAGYEHSVLIWNLGTLTSRPLRLPTNGGYVDANSVEFSPDGRMLAAGFNDLPPGAVMLWDLRTHTRQLLPQHAGWVNFTSDVGASQQHDEYVNIVAFSPDGRTLASMGDGTVALWIPRAHAWHGWSAHQGELDDLAFSPDGRTLATHSTLGRARLWDVRTGALLGSLDSGHTTASPEGVAFSPDGRILASAGGSGTVSLWEVGTRSQIGKPLNGQLGAVRSVEFSPNGRTLAAGGTAGTVLWNGILWRDSGDLRHMVCSLVVGNLTPAEWVELVPGITYRTTCPN